MKKVKVHPYVQWATFAQYKDEPKVKAVSVNGHITEVKQLNNWMGDHLGFIHFVFFQFGYDWQKN